MFTLRNFTAHRILFLCAALTWCESHLCLAVEPIEGLSKAELHAKLVAEGGVAGGCTPPSGSTCCDYCWNGDCPDAFKFDNDCDCGCQWEDPRCPSCDYCWANSGGCDPDYDGDDLGCDCGCDFFDSDCPALVECTSDANCNPDDACFDHYCNTDSNQCQSTPLTSCGDGTCDVDCNENCESCPTDCGCASCSESCVGGSCVAACGDGVCNEACGETCESCASDCGTCGACCRNADVQAAGFNNPCILMSSGGCEQSGGTFLGEGTTCDDTSCLGACCVPAIPYYNLPACLDGVFIGYPIHEYVCEYLFSGTFLGVGSQCRDTSNLTCPTGACCGSTGECADSLDDLGGDVPYGIQITDATCEAIGGSFGGAGTSCDASPCEVPDQRLDTVKKGSLLVFPAAELRWAPSVVAGPGSFTLTRDTIITLVNDFTRDVHVKLYFVNGDAPTEPIYADDLQTILIERGHNGWNQVDCGIELTENESTYLSLANGGNGCQRFTILDPGNPPGRPNLEPDGGRVLRGFVIAFAVDENQNEISFNHLSGHATVIDYDLRSAWEYQSYVFQAINPTAGAPTDGIPGQLNLDGVEYDYAFNQLIFDFYAVGSTVLSNGGVTVMLDTDLTLHPVSADLRQDTCGPITTKAHFDIWNANEEFRSGTTRCITCWDQTLLSAYSVGFGEDNNFILGDLDTDKGKARIDGMASVECDDLFVPPDLDDAILQWLQLHDRPRCDIGCANSTAGCAVAGRVNGEDCCDYTLNESQDAALLGVAAKILNFSGGASGLTHAGMNLVGAGQERAQILFDIPAGPETATTKDHRGQVKNASERNSLGGREDK